MRSTKCTFAARLAGHRGYRLYLDWQGNLTLPAVQQACLALADCYLHRPCARILHNNELVIRLRATAGLLVAPAPAGYAAKLAHEVQALYQRVSARQRTLLAA